MQEILKPRNSIVVFTDYREEKSLVTNILHDKGVDVRLLDLEIGDFVVSDAVCIERKTFNDFVSSVIDGRLFQQAKRMKENYEKPIVIIEGEQNWRKINPNALKAAIASLIVDFEVYVLQTRNQSETANVIYWLAKREQDERNKKVVFKKRVRKPTDVKKLQEYIVSSLPGVSNVLARRLLERFGSVEKIFRVSENELMKVEGIGKKLAEQIRNIVSRRYGE